MFGELCSRAYGDGFTQEFADKFRPRELARAFAVEMRRRSDKALDGAVAPLFSEVCEMRAKPVTPRGREGVVLELWAKERLSISSPDFPEKESRGWRRNRNRLTHGMF